MSFLCGGGCASSEIVWCLVYAEERSSRREKRAYMRGVWGCVRRIEWVVEFDGMFRDANEETETRYLLNCTLARDISRFSELTELRLQRLWRRRERSSNVR